MDLVKLGYSYSRIIHDFYVKNWKDDRGSSKSAIAKRAVTSYLNGTDIKNNVDPTFKALDDKNSEEDLAKIWAHQIDKFFSHSETVKLPYSFGDYLVMALDEEYRKACLIEIDRKRKSVIEAVQPLEGDMLESIQRAIKETSEAISHMVKISPDGLEDDSDQDLLRARQETLEAIQSLEKGLSHLDHEVKRRGIELVEAGA